MTEDQLKRALIKRGFLEAAQRSLTSWLDRLIKECPKLVFYRGEIRADYLGWAAMVEEAPPYENICNEILPNILYEAEPWKQTQEVKNDFPYIRYVHFDPTGAAPMNRVIHWAQHGKIYPVDHEFWNIWYPLNGFPCRCSTMNIPERDLARNYGGKESRLFMPPMTVARPDPGFDFNPGLLNFE